MLEAVACLQDLLRRGQAPRQANPARLPTTVIPKSLQRYLFTKEAGKARALDMDRYEFLVYRLLRNALEAGKTGRQVHRCQSAHRRRPEHPHQNHWDRREAALDLEVIPRRKNRSTARSTANCRVSALPICCGSSPRTPAILGRFAMGSSVMSKTPPIPAKFSPASWPWVRTWAWGKWQRSQGSGMRRC